MTHAHAHGIVLRTLEHCTIHSVAQTVRSVGFSRSTASVSVSGFFVLHFIYRVK